MIMFCGMMIALDSLHKMKHRINVLTAFSDLLIEIDVGVASFSDEIGDIIASSSNKIAERIKEKAKSSGNFLSSWKETGEIFFYIDEDKKLFFNFIDDFGSANLEIQNKATERYIKETERRIKEAKEEFKEKYRLKLAFPLFISFVLAMVLI